MSRDSQRYEFAALPVLAQNPRPKASVGAAGVRWDRWFGTNAIRDFPKRSVALAVLAALVRDRIP